MGGHGGLNILPQKRWNVYNYENREKVRQDEEAAAKEEQLKQEQSRKRDAEFRLERLRHAKGLPDHKHAELHSPTLPDGSESNHINLFEGVKVFQFGEENAVQCSEVQKEGPHSQKRRKTEEKGKVILPEDEKYRLGYGLVGRGVREPWYLSRTFSGTDHKAGSSSTGSENPRNGITQKSGKKSLEELREERLKREKQERERVHMLLTKNGKNGTSANLKNYTRSDRYHHRNPRE